VQIAFDVEPNYGGTGTPARRGASPTAWWRSGLESFIIGMSAAIVAFAVGYGLKVLFQLPAA